MGIVIAMRIEACSILKEVFNFSGTQLTSYVCLNETPSSVVYVTIIDTDWPRFLKLVYATGSFVINCIDIANMQICEIHLLVFPQDC